MHATLAARSGNVRGDDDTACHSRDQGAGAHACYAVQGRQYVAVAAGGNFQINAPRGDEVLAFALDAEGGP